MIDYRYILRPTKKDVLPVYLYPINNSNQFELNSKLFECNSFVSFVNGCYGLDLRSPKLPQPTEFSLERWKVTEGNIYNRHVSHIWNHISNYEFKGVEWFTARHSTDGSDSACYGIVTFNCLESRIVSGSMKSIEVNKQKVDDYTLSVVAAFDHAIRSYYANLKEDLPEICTCDSKDLLWYGCRCKGK